MNNTALQISLPVEALQLAMVEALVHGLRAMADTLEESAPRQVAKTAKAVSPKPMKRPGGRGCDIIVDGQKCPNPHRSLGLCNTHYQKKDLKAAAQAKARALRQEQPAPPQAPAASSSASAEVAPEEATVAPADPPKAPEVKIPEAPPPEPPAAPAAPAAPSSPPAEAQASPEVQAEEPPSKPLPRFPPPRGKGKR